MPGACACGGLCLRPTAKVVATGFGGVIVYRTHALPSPPWGSVWLDRESVLFGDSTLALRQWMRESGIRFEVSKTSQKIILVRCCLLAAGMAVIMNANNSLFYGICFRGRPAFWTYLSIITGHPFYQALGQLARLTLAQWQAQLIIPRRCKTVIPLIPTKAEFYLPFSPY